MVHIHFSAPYGHVPKAMTPHGVMLKQRLAWIHSQNDSRADELPDPPQSRSMGRRKTVLSQGRHRMQAILNDHHTRFVMITGSAFHLNH